jgi:hypothetical protein
MKNQLLFLFIAILFFVSNVTLGQHKISLKEKNGVLYLPCKINGIQLDYVFDTGASIVTINDSIYRLMQSNELITIDDSIGIEKYQDASGDIIECNTFNIKKIEIGGIVLENIKGGVVPNNNKSFLLGQSALKSIGSYNLDIKNKILEINDHALLIDGIYKRSNSTDSVLSYITQEIYLGNQYFIDVFYNKKIQQPTALYSMLDSIINSEEYLMDNTKDTTKLIMAYAYLGLYYLNSAYSFTKDKGREYIKKFIENENFLRYVIRGDQCKIMHDSTYYNIDGKRNNRIFIGEFDSSYYYENKITKERFYEFSKNSDKGSETKYTHRYQHEKMIFESERAINSVIVAMVNHYYESKEYLECIKFGAKTLSILNKNYKQKNGFFDVLEYFNIKTILFDMANSKVALSDYNGALLDIGNLFTIYKLHCNYSKDYYKSMDAECREPYNMYILKGICYYNLKKHAAAIAEIDKYFRKANFDLKKDEEEGVQTVDVENLSLAYFYRGLSKIELKNKQSGCADLSKSGELGFSDAYDVIQEKCN